MTAVVDFEKAEATAEIMAALRELSTLEKLGRTPASANLRF